MKNLLLLSFLTTSAFSQNYELFNPTSKKLFTDYPVPYRTYSIAIDSVITQGNSTYYYNFFTVDSITYNYQSDTCSFWPGPYCKQQNDPSWIGSVIQQDSSDNYSFVNRASNFLNLNLSISIGDTSLFFQNATDKFSIVRQNDDTLSVFGINDSAHFYFIHHTDLLGNSINSQLNGKPIIISKNYGLINFFRIDSFPYNLQPVSIIGSTNPDAGLNAITSEMIYDYQVGDEIQYHETYLIYPASSSYSRFRKLTFLTRTLTTDSLIYTCAQTLFNDTSLQLISDSITLSYYRFDTISSIPFERFDGKFRTLYLDDYCGNKWMTYHTFNQNSDFYCEQDNCWGPLDVFGDPFTYENIFVFGLGMYLSKSEPILIGPLFNLPTTVNQICYFKKNGMPCGNEAIVGMSEIENINPLQVYLNQTDNSLHINAENLILSFDLLDMTGRVIYSQPSYSKQMQIALEKIPPGVYVVRALFYQGKTGISKVLISSH